MSGPGNPGDHSARSLAEILREHGLESEFGTRPGRRRRDDEPKADWPARPAPEDQPPSRLRPAGGAGAGTGARPARPRETPTTPPRGQGRPAVTEAAAAEILRRHGMETELGTRPGRRPGQAGTADWPARPAPEDQPRSRLRPPAEPAPARVARPREEARPGPASTGAGRSSAPPPAAPGRGAAPGSPRPARAAASAGRSAPDLPSGRRAGIPAPDDAVATGSFAAVAAVAAGATAADDDPGTAQPPTVGQGVLAWVRFAVELLVAVAVGVGTYFAFTVLWELVPYVALVAAPAVLTGLVAGVAAWRHRREQAHLGVPLLAVLVFAGTLLVIAPAAGLLSGG